MQRSTAPRALALLLVTAAAIACDEDVTEPRPTVLALEAVVTGLESPVYLTAPAGDDRLFVVEQPGRIRVVSGGELAATPFLDITHRVRCCNEEGLLSMAFAPNFAATGHFFVYFVNLSGDIVVERYTAAPHENVAGTIPAPVLTIPHPTYGNHNGGLARFGPDGMLYLGTGDGGGGGDPNRNGQNVNTLLGKLLRIDVSALPYTVPATNPFVGRTDARPEIWAYGLRNPWRFDLAARSGPAGAADLWIADVGQSRYEEVNAVANAGGLNFGWSVAEGAHCYDAETCDRSGFTEPVYEYDHDDGCSITGGFVYRGGELDELRGHYFFSDFCAGWLASLSRGPAGYTRHDWPIPNIGEVLSFGMDGDGELYLLSALGTVHRIVRAPPTE